MFGSELTRKGVCEQAELVMLPQEYMRVKYYVTMKTRTNQPMQKYRCSYGVSISENVSCESFYNYEGREMYYSNSYEFCVPVVRSRHFHFQFSFQINECIRTSNLSD